MEVKRLDHVALYVADRNAVAGFLTSHLGFHVVDRTDRYTLVGAGGRIGKLTLFDPPNGEAPSPGEIERINIRVADPRAAARRLPEEAGAEDRDGAYHFTGPEGLPFALVRGVGEFTDHDLEGVVLRSAEPEGAARAFAQMGFTPGEDAATVMAGEYRITLSGSGGNGSKGGMLFHLGCLVESAEDHRREAEERGMEVQDFVEGPNTLAVFVRGPEGVSVEYVEHKPSFSLT